MHHVYGMSVLSEPQVPAPVRSWPWLLLEVGLVTVLAGCAGVASAFITLAIKH